MRTSLKFLITVLAAAGALAGCGSSSKTTSATSSAATPATPATSSQPSSAIVKTASNAKLGRTILVDAHGMTLYSLSAERGGKFICAGSPCTQVWHPLTGSAANAGVSSLGTVKRPDGTTQLTYNGMPLYTFAQDRAPGEANGQGLRDVGTWSAVSASSSAATSSPPASTGTTTSGGRYGY